MSHVIPLAVAAEQAGLPVRLLNDWARNGTLPGAHRAKDGVYRSRWLVTVEEFEPAIPSLQRRRERFGYRRHAAQAVLPLRPENAQRATGATRREVLEQRHPVTGLPTTEPVQITIDNPMVSREWVNDTLVPLLNEYRNGTPATPARTVQQHLDEMEQQPARRVSFSPLVVVSLVLGAVIATLAVASLWR